MWQLGMTQGAGASNECVKRMRHGPSNHRICRRRSSSNLPPSSPHHVGQLTGLHLELHNLGSQRPTPAGLAGNLRAGWQWRHGSGCSVAAELRDQVVATATSNR